MPVIKHFIISQSNTFQPQQTAVTTTSRMAERQLRNSADRSRHACHFSVTFGETEWQIRTKARSDCRVRYDTWPLNKERPTWCHLLFFISLFTTVNNEIKKARNFKLVFLYSTTKMMHGPINIRYLTVFIKNWRRQSMYYNVTFRGVRVTTVALPRANSIK